MKDYEVLKEETKQHIRYDKNGENWIAYLTLNRPDARKNRFLPPLLSSLASPPLALLVPFLVFTVHNSYPLLSTEMLFVTGGVALCGLLLALLRHLGGFWGRAAALAFSSGTAVKLHLATIAPYLVLTLVAGAVLGLAALVRDRLFRVAAAMLGVLVFSTPLVERGLVLVNE